MPKWAFIWSLGLAVLIAGAWRICPDGLCGLVAFDRYGLSLAHAWRTETLDILMQGITWLGSLALLVPLALGMSASLVRQSRQREAVFILLALLGSSAVAHVTKLVIERPRPDLFATWLAMPADWSYPSAHAMQATSLAVAWLLVTGQRRRILAGVLGIIVLWVGLSRIYLQVHFPSDVIAGTLAAIAWVGGLYWLTFRREGRGLSGHKRRHAA
ncbi:MAG: phosphatase PAP2 family protein [Thiobacillus sp.]|nr:phosphatase PAP2 family protein [Thiobacillus sp.]